MHRGGRCAQRTLGVVVAACASVVSILGVVPLSPSAGAAVTQSPSSNSKYQFSVEPYAAKGAQQRSNFSYELQPGHAVLDQVAVLNASSSPETFIAYPEDATNVPGSGGFGFQEQGKIHNQAVGKWITIGHPSFVVPAGEEVIDTFQLSIPADAPPGDHVGAIVVQQLHAEQTTNSKEGVNLVLRIAVPIFLRVVGPIRPGLTVENVTVYHQSPAFPYLSGPAKTAVSFTLVNTGNVILNPNKATVSITALIGGTIHSYTVHRKSGPESKTNPLPAEMLPGGQFVLTELWSGIPPFDPLTAHVTVAASDSTSQLPIVAASSSTFWYFPWIPVVILAVLIIGFILWRRRRRRARGADTPPDPTFVEKVSDPSGGAAAAPVEEVSV